MGTRGDKVPRNEVALQCSVYPGRGETCAAVPQMHLCHILCSRCLCHTMQRCRWLNAGANAGATQCTPGRILLRARWLLLQHTLLSFSQFILLFKILLFPKPSPRVPLESTPSCFYPTPHSCTHPTLIPASSYSSPTYSLFSSPFFHRALS